LTAVEFLNPRVTWGFQDYEASELVAFLAEKYPATLTRWIRSRIESGMSSGGVYESLPHGAWETLHVLPHASKDELWTAFKNVPVVRWLLARELVGPDMEWLRHAV